MNAWTSRALIDLDAYARNLAVVRGLIPATARIIAVVKADAYGHGAVAIARRAVRERVYMLGVATVAEANQLRAGGVSTPVLVMVQPPPDHFDDAVALELGVMVSCYEAAQGLADAARHRRRRVRLHLKVDTGMGRQGAALADVPDLLRRMVALEGVEVEGIATHFATCERADDPFTIGQIEAFRSLLDTLEKAGLRPPLAHTSSSGAIINYPAIASFDAVRPGLMAYGVWPCDSPSQVEPVLRWETRVSLVRDLPAGVTVGYGRTYTTPDPLRVAVLPVGYADGYKWSLANRGEALIRGIRCPVLGRVSMDQIVVNVTPVPGIVPGDTAVLIGAEGGQTITARDIARQAGTIPYDIFTGLGSRVARVTLE